MTSELIFRPLEESEIPEMFRIIMDRVKWMDKVGISQWNTTDYAGVYPLSYYAECFQKGELFALADGESLLCVGALKAEDDRWAHLPELAAQPAFYLHHFAAVLGQKGIGSCFLQMAEQYATECGKAYFRLDSSVDNPTLTNYYTARGYLPCGACVDGDYVGILRQKALS